MNLACLPQPDLGNRQSGRAEDPPTVQVALNARARARARAHDPKESRWTSTVRTRTRRQMR